MPKSITVSTVSTLGDLAENGMELAWDCDDCHRGLDLTRAVELWGRQQRFFKWKAPVKCAPGLDPSTAGKRKSTRFTFTVKADGGLPVSY